MPDRTAPIYAYIGAYTTEGYKGHGGGINVFQIDPNSGEWTPVQLVKEVDDPSFLVVDSTRRFLYAASESRDTVSAFSIDPQSGQLTLLNTRPTQGANPAALNLDPRDRVAVAGNYSAGSVAVLPIEPDGKLAPLSQLLQLEGECGPDPQEQNSSHPHDICFDPAGRYLLVPDKGYDRVYVYKFDAESRNLEANDPPYVMERAGAGPRHLTFHPTAPYAYLINELDSTINVFSYDAEHGTLESLQVVSTLPPDFSAANTCAEIRVAPSGRFLYGSNRGHDSVVVYALDPNNGQLSPLEWAPCGGKGPRFFTLDPWGEKLYVANQYSDTIVTFQVDQERGKLTPSGQVIETGTPVCIAFSF
jgi:6-phosphogluconolactonase (cycloisomerase 2 family)